MRKNNFNLFAALSIKLCLVLALTLTALFTWRAQLSFAGYGALKEVKPARSDVQLNSEKYNEQKGQKILQIVGSPVFAEFDAWTKSYYNGNFRNSGDEFFKKGEELAIKRRRLLNELIRFSPETALRHSVSEATYNRLPAFIAEHLERRVDARGDFTVSISDEVGEPDEQTHRVEIKREVIIGDVRREAFVYGRKTAMTTKSNIPLRGIILDDAMAVEENSVEKIEPIDFAARNINRSTLGENGVAAKIGGETFYFSNETKYNDYVRRLTARETKIEPRGFDSKTVENQSSPWTEGAKTVLVIRVDFPDRTGEPVDQSGAPLTETRAQSVINNAVNPFYVSNSYSKTSLQNPVVTPVVRMPQPQSFYNGFNINTAMLTDARNAARAAGFETNNYDLDIIAFSFTQNLSFSGSAIIGGKGLFLNGFFDFKTIAHELGHNFGLLHANLWRTTDGTAIGNGANVEYGDSFDLMGGGASQITHFSAGYKRRLDWLTEANVQTVTTSGTYRIYSFDNVSNPAGIHALKIRKDNTKDYWIELRQLFASTPTLANGAFVRWDFAAQGLRQTQILDLTPATTTLADAPLQIGQTFSDNAAGITVTVLGKGNTTPESLEIKVEINFAQIKGVAYDFDGDNKSDIGVFRPEGGDWYLNRSTAGFQAVNWGLPNDKIVPAKYTDNRRTDIAVYRDGIWYVYNSFGGSPLIVQFGSREDIPVPADYDGDGRAEMAVYRPSNGTWYLWNWILQRFSAVRFGIESDKPVPADYDGDGKTDIAVFRPQTGVWYLLRSNAGFTAAQFGVAEDKPVQADYDGDGKADVAVFRPQTGVWYRLGSESGFSAVQWGVATDLPSPGDYDGDGKSDAVVYRPSDRTWYLMQSRQGFAGQQFGISSDKPIANSFVP